MSNRKTEPALNDRLRGMLLLSAYGDAMGADHEPQRTILSAPLPTRLPEQELIAVADRWGYWATTRQLNPPVKGLTTDDTAFKLFILHPWLEKIWTGTSSLNENGLRQFLIQLQSTEIEPAWIRTPRDAQIQSWLSMYRAADANETSEFFTPEVPIIFGLFMFLELAALRTDYSAVENYQYFRDFTILDQGYASSATGFLISITSRAFSSDPSNRFDDWLLQESKTLCNELLENDIDTKEISTILRIVESMTELGKRSRGTTPRDFMVAFEAAVVDPHRPPFMAVSFQNAIFDPLRVLAEIYAAAAYAVSDPAAAIRPLAFGSGDSDTVCAMFGILLGIWFGETALRQHEDLDADLTIVESLLNEIFEIDLNKHVELFVRLLGESKIPPVA